MAQVNDGDTVRIHYTGTLSDGTVFDSSQDREPIEFTVGEGQVIPGFEKAVKGMAVGDAAKATVPAEEAYGPRRDDLVLTIPKDNLPDGIEPKPGDALQASTPEGQTIPVRVMEVQESTVLLDANHPLAGQDLTFDLRLVDIT